MKSIKIISILIVLALGMTPLLGITAEAQVTGTQILDSEYDIGAYDFSGDYVAYLNTVPSGSLDHVKIYN